MRSVCVPPPATMPLPWTLAHHLLLPARAPGAAPAAVHVRVFADRWTAPFVVLGELGDHPWTTPRIVGAAIRRLRREQIVDADATIASYRPTASVPFRLHAGPDDVEGTPLPSWPAPDDAPGDPTAVGRSVLRCGPTVDVWAPEHYTAGVLRTAGRTRVPA
ncbi:hypothetical protein ACVU7I_10310 [Patulibacter sp. S7RM1-6]